MDILLRKIKDSSEEGCVTVLMNTHRTKPGYLDDPLKLKNLIKEAEQRLNTDYDKRFATPIIKNLNDVANQIDYSRNLDSLAIFASREIGEYATFPIDVMDRVVIDNTFATRDIIRAMHGESAYYVLVISQQQARLIEAYNDRLVAENTVYFPVVNTLFTTSRSKRSTAKGQDQLVEEFFNQVDKTLWEAIQSHPLPVLLAAEARNAEHYLKVADKKDLLIGVINRKHDDKPVQHILPDAWEAKKEFTKQRTAARIVELKQAVNTVKFVSDYQEIWDAVHQGRGRTLFVRRGFFQPAALTDGKIQLVDESRRNDKGVIDDIVDEIIEQNLRFGGDVVFVEGNELDDFQNLVLTTRY